MARKTIEDKLLEKKDHLENMLESLESPAMAHIKHIYFNAAGEQFLIARKYRGELYSQLSIKSIFIDDGDTTPIEDEQAAWDDDGKVKAAFIPYPDSVKYKIVKTLTKEKAKEYYQAQLDAVKAEIEDLYEPRVAKKTLKTEQRVKASAAK